MGTYNRLVKFGLKIPNRLGKMSENVRGRFFWLTLYMPKSYNTCVRMSSWPTMCSSVLATSGGTVFCSSCCVDVDGCKWCWLLRRLELWDDRAAWSPELSSNSSRPLLLHGIPLNYNQSQHCSICNWGIRTTMHSCCDPETAVTEE